jgi:membrane protease YdiL (CAAX protease family)
MPAAAIDLFILIAGYVLTAFIARAAGLPFPGSIAVIASLLLASWRLSRHSESWPGVGVRTPRSWGGVALSVIGIYATVAAAMILLVTPLADAMRWPALDTSAFASVRGNAATLAGMLVLVWTVVAFGEELIFRGFILSRLQRLLGPGATGGAVAVVLQAALFGVGHFYLGARGMAAATLVGIVYGSWYLLRERNLWPLIIAHGVTDTISMVAIYAGVVP